MSRTIDGRRSAPVNPNNDPHYYSYKLVDQPAPPSPSSFQQNDEYDFQADNGEEMEEMTLSDTEEVHLNGTREEVMARLNRRIAALQNKSRRYNTDLYGEDYGYTNENNSTLEHVESDGM